MLDTYGYKHTLRICNTAFFFNTYEYMVGFVKFKLKEDSGPASDAV